MKIHILVTAFNRPKDLERLILDFQLQTRDNWTMRILHDGMPERNCNFKLVSHFVEHDDRIEFSCTDDIKGHFGHPNRRKMLEELNADPDDYVLITNDDNQYVKSFIEIFSRNCNDAVGMIFCNTVHNYFDYDILVTRVGVGGIDMGSFIVRYDIASKVGFTHTVEVADGIYAEECAAECARQDLKVMRINKALFIHN